MLDIYSALLPVIRLFPPEAAHNLTIRFLTLGFGPRDRMIDDPALATEVWGIKFVNPIGLSAGFDKGAQVPDAMMRAGFGFAEAGTVTPLPQPGNPKPRMFRLLHDRAAINRLGINSQGLGPYVRRISKRGVGAGPLGANIGSNKVTTDTAADYEIGIEAVAPYVDYLVCNISCPNVTGHSATQERAKLVDIIERSLKARARAVMHKSKTPPVIIKISPDLDSAQRADIATTILESGIDGITVSNTTVQRPSQMSDRQKEEAGGLSGAPLFPVALEMVSEMYRQTNGNVPIIGCGGVASGNDAYKMIRAGASLVQLYTALIFHGPALIPQIKADLVERLKKDGFSSISEAVGADHRSN